MNKNNILILGMCFLLIESCNITSSQKEPKNDIIKNDTKFVFGDSITCSSKDMFFFNSLKKCDQIHHIDSIYFKDKKARIKLGENCLTKMMLFMFEYQVDSSNLSLSPWFDGGIGYTADTFINVDIKKLKSKYNCISVSSPKNRTE